MGLFLLEEKEILAVKLSREQVLHIAELAKLGLSEKEVALFAEQLSDILDYAEMLNRLDTGAIPATAQVLDIRNVTRGDQVRSSLTPEQVLANAPQRQDDQFRVKPILE